MPQAVVKIIDLKCPDSGMAEKMDLANLDLLSLHTLLWPGLKRGV